MQSRSNPSSVRTLVADDEPVARERIVALLREEADVELVGICTDGDEAIQRIRTERPDLVLLDIDMPAANGLALASALDDDATPVVVFVTAYDQFAVRAFEIQATDYLLKPFSRQRFTLMMARARDAVLRRRADRSHPRGSTPPIYPERLVVRGTGRIYFVRVDEIDWCEAAGNYISLHVGREEHLVRKTMGELERLLDPSRFLRIHRSTIVNTSRVSELRPLFGGDYLILLRTGTELTLSRRFRRAAALLLGDASSAG